MSEDVDVIVALRVDDAQGVQLVPGSVNRACSKCGSSCYVTPATAALGGSAPVVCTRCFEVPT